MPDTLSADTRRALDAIAAQLEGYSEALRGLCIVGETVQTQHGRFGPPSNRQDIEQPVGDLEEDHEMEDFIPFLVGGGYERTEAVLSDGSRALRVVPTEPHESEIRGVDFVIETSPARMVHASLHPPRLPRLAGWIVQAPVTEMRFEQVRGVPMAVEMRVRMRTRGIGRFRFDHETVTTVRYEPCEG
ncbi:MAG: hypothetical protein AAGI52_13825 [Bacteroidota bacterium]